MKSLPLKYRPQQIEDLIGQQFITTTLKNALTANKIAPAYLSLFCHFPRYNLTLKRLQRFGNFSFYY